MFKFYLYKIGQFLVNRLPVNFAYAFSVFMSDWQYRLSFRDRRSVKNNLRVMGIPEKEIPTVAREVFRNFGKYLVDFFRMQRTVNREYIDKHVTVEHVERFAETLKAGKGGILITAHIGNWELGAAVMSHLGYTFTAVALPHKERPVNDLFNQQREAWGVTIVPMSSAVRKCLEALRANKLIALVADRDFSNHGEVMDFLGRQALIPKGPAVFSAKTGAAILPTFFIRNRDNTFKLVIKEPIYPSAIYEDNIPSEVIMDIMKKYTAVIEEAIRQYPSQWLMFREFWIK